MRVENLHTHQQGTKMNTVNFFFLTRRLEISSGQAILLICNNPANHYRHVSLRGCINTVVGG